MSGLVRAESGRRTLERQCKTDGGKPERACDLKTETAWGRTMVSPMSNCEPRARQHFRRTTKTDVAIVSSEKIKLVMSKSDDRAMDTTEKKLP